MLWPSAHLPPAPLTSPPPLLRSTFHFTFQLTPSTSNQPSNFHLPPPYLPPTPLTHPPPLPPSTSTSTFQLPPSNSHLHLQLTPSNSTSHLPPPPTFPTITFHLHFHLPTPTYHTLQPTSLISTHTYHTIGKCGYAAPNHKGPMFWWLGWIHPGTISPGTLAS